MEALTAAVETSLQTEAGITVEVIGVAVQAVAVAPTEAPVPAPAPVPPPPLTPVDTRLPTGLGLFTFLVAFALFALIGAVLVFFSKSQSSQVLRTVSVQEQQFKMQRQKSAQYAP